MAAPIRVGDHELTVAVSIGGVEGPMADTNPTELLRAADITLRRAKGDGKGRYSMSDRPAGNDFDRTDRHAGAET